MKKIVVLLIVVGSILTLNAQTTEFTQDALQDVFIDLNDNEVTFASILENHKGKTLFIDVWASWCGDCVRGMPGVKQLINENKNIQFVFLSVDRAQDKWKAGIKKYDINNGDHYYIKSGWKGSAFCKAINLDWIPRYMVVDKEGKIALFKAIVTNDKELINTLNTIQ
jgi:thiol-disulfide isomerase/thioredoxin